MTTPPQQTTTPSGVAGAITAVMLWSAGNLIVINIPMSGIQVAFWRTALAAAVYWGALKASGRTLTRQNMRASLPAALLISFELAVFFTAIKTTTIANATIIGSLQPLVLLIFGTHRFGERRSGILIGLATVSIGGVAMVALGSASQAVWSPLGDGLAFVAMLLFSGYFVYAKQARATVDAFAFQTAVWIIGTVALLPIAIVDAGSFVVPTSGNWLWVAAMVAVPGTGHLLMNWAHPRIRLSLAAILSLGITVFSTAGGAVFHDQPITGWQLPGIAIVLAAMIVAIRYDASVRRRRAVPTGLESPSPEPV